MLFMSLIESTLLNFFQQYPQCPIVIAYSGGVDSQVLLHALASLKQQQAINNDVSVCHVNHGLSKNARKWQQFAHQQCMQLKLPLAVFEVNVQAKPQQSLEALARDARYHALRRSSPDNALIVTGHHSDDQSETFLLALKRGSGLKGLSAMAQVSQLNPQHLNQLLVRPLLKLTRKDITDYAKKHNLTWIEDESNQDTSFDRNFLRHQIMPLLTERWPSMLSTISRSAEHCREGQTLLTELAQQDLTLCQLSLDSLAVVELLILSKARFNNVVRYFLQCQQCLMPSSEQLEQVHQQLLAQADKSPAVKVGDHWLRRFKEVLYFTPDFSDISSWQTVLNDNLSDEQTVQLPDGLGVLDFVQESSGAGSSKHGPSKHCQSKHSPSKHCSVSHHYKILAPQQNEKISIRFTHENPTCLPDYRQKNRPLKKVLQELAIPPWQRKRIPFLYYNDVLVVALGHFICQEYLGQEESSLINVHWIK